MNALTSARKIYDPVHGFIRFNEIEKELIDSLPFQRLHHIRQLGIAFLVYPGATHTRFEHSLGTMEVATRIFDHLLKQGMEIEDAPYWKQIVRLAALCHDLGHLPFSHDAESEVLGKQGHEAWTVRVIHSQMLQPVWDALSVHYPHRNIAQDIASIAVGGEKLESEETIASEIITADFFGADRIDYLLRDAKCTGVSYGTFDYHQLIEMLCILPSGLGIEENGVESCEALLLARHFMHQRVYQYSSVQACKFHLKRFMKRYYAAGDYLSSLEKYLSLSDNEILTALRAAVQDVDAVGVLQHRSRFRPIEIDATLSEENLLQICASLALPSHAVHWNFFKEKKESDFPGSRIRIPQGKKGWIFIAPEFEKSFRRAFRAHLQKVLHA